VRFKTFPDYLWVQLKKFATSEDWTPVKLDIEVTMPDELDLGCLKAPGGMQPGEEPLPEEEVGQKMDLCLDIFCYNNLVFSGPCS
jgi:ubiquitin carboxyl-terminal hydrolase 5/13